MRECLLCGTLFSPQESVPTATWGSRQSRICAFCWASDNEDVQQEKALHTFIRRDDNIQRKYGLTPEAFSAILKKQRYRCAICEKEFGTDRKSFLPHVDHCHETGAVRGLLCLNCNLMIGSAKDNPKTLFKAIGYLHEATIGTNTS